MKDTTATNSAVDWIFSLQRICRRRLVTLQKFHRRKQRRRFTIEPPSTCNDTAEASPSKWKSLQKLHHRNHHRSAVRLQTVHRRNYHRPEVISRKKKIYNQNISKVVFLYFKKFGHINFVEANLCYITFLDRHMETPIKTIMYCV